MAYFLLRSFRVSRFGTADRNSETCNRNRSRDIQQGAAEARKWTDGVVVAVTLACVSLLLAGCGASYVVRGASGSGGSSSTSTGSIAASPSSVNFGTVSVGQSANSNVVLTNQGKEPVEVSQLSVSGENFSINGQGDLPVTLGAGSTMSFKVHFDPTSNGASTGQVIATTNSSITPTASIKLQGNGKNAATTVSNNSLSCTNSTMTGTGTDICTVTLGTADAFNVTNVSLSSSSIDVTLPAVVTVPAGSISASFTASVTAVSSAQTATLTATINGASSTFSLQLDPYAAALSLSASNIAFGNETVNTTTTKSVTLTSSGTAPVTISSASATGNGFSISGLVLPMTLQPNQTAKVNVQFDPMAAGSDSGQLSISSTSASNPTALVSLSGTGTSAPPTSSLSAIACTQGSMTGAGTDSCTVTLSSAAGSGGVIVSLSSSDSAVSVPSSVTVPANATSAGFTATVTAVTSTQTATLAASNTDVTKDFALQLNAYTATLSVSTGSLAFGNEAVNVPVQESVTLVSTGTAPVTVNSATISGKGFSMSALALPMTLQPNQSTKINVQFDPTAAGSDSGQLSISSTSASNPTALVSLSGTGTSTPPTSSLSAIACTQGSMTGAGTDSCTVTLSSAAGSGGVIVSLSSSDSAVSVPSSVTVPANATSAGFTAMVTAVTSTQTATLAASNTDVTKDFALQLNATTPTLALSATSVSFGDVTVGQTVKKSITLSSTGTGAVSISALSVAGSLFSATGLSVPVTLNPGQSATLTLEFNAQGTSQYTGVLTIYSNSSTGNMTVDMSAQGTAAPGSLSGITCSKGSITGSGSDACTVSLNSAAGSGGTIVSLSSSDSAVSVPSSVTVPANATSAGFTATVSAVTSAQTATLEAGSGGVTKDFALQLGATTPTLSASTTNVSFGNVTVGQTGTQSLTLTSTGNGPVSISAISIAGSLFSASGLTVPATLNPGQSATLTLHMLAQSASNFTGVLTIYSNSSTGNTVVNMSGAGTSAPGTLSALTCASGSVSAAGTVACTVSLSAAAGSAGVQVSLASNNSAVAVPSSVTVPANATSASFNATVSSFSSQQTVTLTASSGGATESFVLQLSTGSEILSINATTISFGSVVIDSPATQSITLTSTGTSAVTVNSASTGGTGFSISGVNFPITLNPGQTATLNVQFDPTSSGTASGNLTISSTSSTNPTAVIPLSGTGAPHEVDLSWSAPTPGTDPVAGYNIYRSPSGGTAYQQVGTTKASQTTYMDNTVAGSQTYDYVVKSYDSSGNESTPSNMTSVTIP
ncbi:MAG TPA: choice-of-anchor D domain-containing protein [Terracidiphilus sp.]|nr:choice-of-anchor D domain-containing protein [Terracidiphilus sp.]